MFQPSIHGWPFGNTYACTGSELGLGGPPPPQLGLGGGLCWTALDRYLRGTAIDAETAAPDPGDPLHTELVQRQVAALAGVWTRVRDWQSAPAGSWRDMLPVPLPLGGADVASRTRAEWRGIRRRLARGEPVLLTILGENDGYDGVRSVRQVLATGWSRQGSRVAVSIYDPDRPGDDDVRLMFGLTGRRDGRVPGADVRGFFAVPYDRTPLAPLPPGSIWMPKM